MSHFHPRDELNQPAHVSSLMSAKERQTTLTSGNRCRPVGESTTSRYKLADSLLNRSVFFRRREWRRRSLLRQYDVVVALRGGKSTMNERRFHPTTRPLLHKARVGVRAEGESLVIFSADDGLCSCGSVNACARIGKATGLFFYNQEVEAALAQRTCPLAARLEWWIAS